MLKGSTQLMLRNMDFDFGLVAHRLGRVAAIAMTAGGSRHMGCGSPLKITDLPIRGVGSTVQEYTRHSNDELD